jgi:hypothetical protein
MWQLMLGLFVGNWISYPILFGKRFFWHGFMIGLLAAVIVWCLFTVTHHHP